MPQPDHITALNLPPLDRDTLEPGMAKYFSVCEDKLGIIPNVLQAYAFNPAKLGAFVDFYNEAMLGESRLSKLEREMIAVVVSAVNRCYYCLTAHGAAVRQLSGDPELGEMLVMNYRVAPLSERHRAMLDFAVKLTERLSEITEADRERLRQVGFEEADIWDIAAVTGLFNLTNRVASAVDMMPNREYHRMAR